MTDVAKENLVIDQARRREDSTEESAGGTDKRFARNVFILSRRFADAGETVGCGFKTGEFVGDWHRLWV